MGFTAKGVFQTIYSRIRLNRTTTFFFIFSLLYCLSQGLIQSFLYSSDNEHRDLLSAIVRSVIPPGNMTFVTGSPRTQNARLEICNDVPQLLITGNKNVPYPCTTVFHSELDRAGGSRSSQIPDTRFVNWENGLEVYSPRTFDNSTVAIYTDSNASPAEYLSVFDGVTLHPLPERNQTVSLSLRCVQMLAYPQQTLTDARREDLALLALQFWLVAISVLAVVKDSVPHLITAMTTRTLLTGWSAFTLWRTTRDKALYQHLLADPGTPCSLDLFESSNYFARRLALQIADLALSCTALLVFLWLTLKLLKAYNTAAFQCVGPPEFIHAINKLFLALLSTLQLEAFVLTTSMAMWADALLNTAIGNVTRLMRVYIAVFVVTTLVLLPWIVMGWHATKRERKWMMHGFLFVGFLILSAWLVMFYSLIYRWTFLQWPFLGCFTVASLVLLIASFVLGVVCRTHFGKGHAEYLRAEEALSSLNFTREVFSRSERRDNESFDLAPVTLPTIFSPAAIRDRKGSFGDSPTTAASIRSFGSKKDLKLSSLTSAMTRDRKGSLGSDRALDIYYIQTLESDGGVDIGELPAQARKGPFARQ